MKKVQFSGVEADVGAPYYSVRVVRSRNQYHIVKQFSSNYKNVYYLLSGFPSKVSLVAKMVKNLPAMQETRV